MQKKSRPIWRPVERHQWRPEGFTSQRWGPVGKVNKTGPVGWMKPEYLFDYFFVGAYFTKNNKLLLHRCSALVLSGTNKPQLLNWCLYFSTLPIKRLVAKLGPTLLRFALRPRHKRMVARGGKPKKASTCFTLACCPFFQIR